MAVVIAAGAALPASANDTGTVRAVVQGDLDGSGIVDEADLGLLSQAAASAPAGGQASQEDLAAGDICIQTGEASLYLHADGRIDLTGTLYVNGTLYKPCTCETLVPAE